MDSAAYLARIGASADDDLATLAARHYRSVPFENLAIHLGETVDTRPERLFDKIVRRRRGGFCYELNGAFAWLLGELGYEVGLLGGRVHAPGGDTPPMAHMALRVHDEGRPRLVDVGFGGFLVLPTALDEPSDQVDPQPDGDVEVRGADGRAGYRLEPPVRSRTDFGPPATGPPRTPTRASPAAPPARCPCPRAGAPPWPTTG